jgi:putative peptide zinc metalloprotease protein
MATYLPLRPGCSFHPFHNGSGSHDYIVRTPDNRQFRVPAAAYEILKELDRGVSLEKIYETLPEQQVTFTEFYEFILTHYQSVLAAGSEAETRQSRTPTRLLLHHLVLPQPLVGAIAGRLSGAYQPVLAFFLFAVIVAAHVALYVGHVPAKHATIHASVVLLATFISVLIHEFGHASAVARYGGTPGGIGAGLYIFMPVLYADVSHVWTFKQKHRVVVDLGGIYFQQIVFAVLALPALLLHSASLRLACISIDAMTIVSINPVFRFDGYWVLVDWLGVPNLHRQATGYLKLVLQSLIRFRWVRPDQDSLQQSGLKTAVFATYAVAGNLLLTLVILLNVRWIGTVTARVLHRTPLLWAEGLRAFQQHQLLHAFDVMTGFLFTIASGLTLIVALWMRGKQVGLAIGRHIQLRKLS